MTDVKEQTAQNKSAKKLDIRNYAELVELGRNSLEQKKFDFALKVLMQAIQLDTNGYEAYFERGRYYFYMENYELSLGDFNKTIQLNPKFSKAYRAVSAYYKKQNNDELYFEWIKKAAELGDIISQYRIGIHYRYGIKIEKNLELAFKWLNKAAEQGNIEAQYQLADCYLDGIGIGENKNLAFEWFKKAAEQGNIEAQYKLAECYLDGIGIWENTQLAFEWFKRADEQGHIDAKYKLADCYLNGIGIRKNPELGFKLFKKLAEQGNTKAETILYDYFLHDKENENLEQDLQWFQEKAEQGDIDAYYLLADVYFKGIKVKKNRILALEWLEKSLTHEKSNKNRLADIFLEFAFSFESDNSEVEINKQKIIDLYIKAAEYSSANACIRLADYYRLGNYVEKNDELAFEYYKKSYEIAIIENEPFGKYPDIISLASEQLSSYYAEGKIVKKDAALAEFYQQQIIAKKDAIKFPYKSSLDYWFDEMTLAGNEKVYSLISKGCFDEAKETIQNDDDIEPYALSIDYVDAKKELHEKYQEFESDNINVRKELDKKNDELRKSNAELEKTKKQLELEVQKKEAAQKQVEEKNKELNNLIAMFAHNFLGTLQCIRSNAEHDNNAKIHLKTVKMMSGALTAFSIISADDEKLIEQLKQDNKGEINLQQNLANNLALAISQLLSQTNKDKIINIYLNYLHKTAQIKPETNGEDLRFNDDDWEKWQALQHQWEDEFNALFSETVDLSRLQTWLETNFFPVQIIGFNDYNIRFKEFGITDSIFLVIFMEILVNALKYSDVSQNQPLTITLCKKDQHYQLTCENPSAHETNRGSHKGTDFLKSIAHKVNGQFITESTEQSFKSTFIIPAELLE